MYFFYFLCKILVIWWNFCFFCKKLVMPQFFSFSREKIVMRRISCLSCEKIGHAAKFFIFRHKKFVMRQFLLLFLKKTGQEKIFCFSWEKLVLWQIFSLCLQKIVMWQLFLLLLQIIGHDKRLLSHDEFFSGKSKNSSQQQIFSEKIKKSSHHQLFSQIAKKSLHGQFFYRKSKNFVKWPKFCRKSKNQKTTHEKGLKLSTELFLRKSWSFEGLEACNGAWNYLQAFILMSGKVYRLIFVAILIWLTLFKILQLGIFHVAIHTPFIGILLLTAIWHPELFLHQASKNICKQKKKESNMRPYQWLSQEKYHSEGTYRNKSSTLLQQREDWKHLELFNLGHNCNVAFSTSASTNLSSKLKCEKDEVDEQNWLIVNQ